jgi:DNA-binding NarL/FixJ family response regulator
MIRTLIVDDHPAVRGGLVRALRSEPGLVPVATAGGVTEALAAASQVRPGVVLADYQLPDGDGLALCHELKRLASPPAVIVYSAFARRELALAAALAGADGLVDKGASLEELFGAIRAVAKGSTALPELEGQAIERIAARVEPEDLPILGMRMDGATPSEIATVLQIGERELSRRLAGLVGRIAAGPAASDRNGDAGTR